MQIREKDFIGKAVGKMAVEELADYAKARMAELEKTKRLLIVVVAILVVSSSALFVFAPQERDTVATIMGTVLLVLALGAIGASKFILKTPFGTIEADNDSPKPEHVGGEGQLDETPKAQV